MIELTKPELQKHFYKHGTIAFFQHIRKGNAYYIAYVATDPDEPERRDQTVQFLIPFEEMKEGTFDAEMPAKSLVRWIL